MNPVQWIYFFYFLWHIHVFYSVLLLYVHLLFIIILSGNAVSIVVLLDPSMRNCFNQLLVTLNISDRFVFQSVIIKKIWNTSNFFLQFSYNFCDIGSTENRFSWILWEDNSSGFLSLPSFSLSRIQVDIDTNSLNTSQYLYIISSALLWQALVTVLLRSEHRKLKMCYYLNMSCMHIAT